jgi:hypothetical protein
MGSVVWKREVTQKVMEKSRMTRKSVESMLSSPERGGVKECGMELMRADRWGGYAMWDERAVSQSRHMNTDGIEKFCCHRGNTEKGLIRSVECIMEVPVRIAELTSQAKEREKVGYTVRDGFGEHKPRRNQLFNEIEEVHSGLRSFNHD